MGFKKRFNLSQRKRDKEAIDRKDRFMEKVRKAGKEENCAIVPIITKYGLEIEVQVVEADKKIPKELIEAAKDDLKSQRETEEKNE